MHIAVLANLKQNAPTWPGMSPDQWDDLDSEKTIKMIMAALEQGGHTATFLEGNATLFQTLPAVKPDICFNICEGHFGDGREAHVPAMLEMLRMPYTGSRVTTLALTLDKPLTKHVLAAHGLPTPAFQVFERVDDVLLPHLTFPLFVKPSREGTGMGVSGDSIVHNQAELRRQVELIVTRYQQPALVEQFIAGREITMGVIGNVGGSPTNGNGYGQGYYPQSGLHFFPPLEVDMTAYPAEEKGVYTNRIKVELVDTFHYTCPAPLSPSLLAELQRLTEATFRATGCVDVARVDFRLDENDNDKPYILEINPLPGLNPGYSDLCIEAAADGWTYEMLINRIVAEAARRYQLQSAPTLAM